MVPRITILLFTVILLELSVVNGQKAKGKKDPDVSELLVAVQNTVTGFAGITELIGQQNKAISDIMISFNDAKAEMEKFQSIREDKIKELDTKLSQQMENLSTKFFEQLSILNDKLSDSDNKTTTKLDELRDEAESVENSTSAKIEDLASKLKESKQENEQLRNTTNLLIADVANTTTLLIADVASNVTSDLTSKISDVASSATSEIKDLTSKISDVASSATSGIDDLTAKISDVASSATSEIKDLTSKISDVESVAGKWPSGSYCIFRSGGSCPSGFTSYYGYAKEIYQYAPSSTNYMSAVTFGDSYLGCNSACDKGTDNVRDTNLVINSCCK